MLKKMCLALSLFAFCSIGFADTCPSVTDIKHNALNGWKAYDSDEGTPLSATRESHFKKSVEQFALAEWQQGKKHSTAIHCYYRDKSGSNLEAYLSKDHYTPKRSGQHYWYEVSGYMHCAAEKDLCEFDSLMANKAQLARG